MMGIIDNRRIGVLSLKKGIFLNHPKRFGRCQKASKCVKMSKETIKNIYETFTTKPV